MDLIRTYSESDPDDDDDILSTSDVAITNLNTDPDRDDDDTFTASDVAMMNLNTDPGGISWQHATDISSTVQAPTSSTQCDSTPINKDCLWEITSQDVLTLSTPINPDCPWPITSQEKGTHGSCSEEDVFMECTPINYEYQEFLILPLAHRKFCNKILNDEENYNNDVARNILILEQHLHIHRKK